MDVDHGAGTLIVKSSKSRTSCLQHDVLARYVLPW